MKWSQNLLSIGILFLIAGLILLVVSSSGIGTSTFFIFPFFFVSTSDVFAMVAMLAFTFFVFLVMMRSAVTYFREAEAMSDGELMKEYIPVGFKCDVCSAPLPVDAVFCSSCGNPVSYENTSDQ